MKHMKSFEPDDKLLDKIIAVAYGDAGFFEKRKIKRLAKINPEVDALLKEYSDTADAVKTLEHDECPEIVIQNAAGATGENDINRKSFLADLFSLAYSRPVVSLAATVILLIAVFTTVFVDRPVNKPNYTAEEIRVADQQAREALAIVGRIFESTNLALKNEILKEKVSQPVHEGMQTVNQLFDKENKNEIN